MFEFDEVAYKEWADAHEYEIPRQFNFLGSRYNLVTWQEAQKLYYFAVEEIKMWYGIKHLSDKPYIRASLRAKFEGKLKSLQHHREKPRADLSWEDMV